jgi:hypothetical protein
MAEVRSRRTAGSRRGRGRGRGQGQRRLPTWEVSDSDPEGANTAEAGAEAGGVAGERRAAVKARRPEQVLRRLVVCVDPGAGPGTRGRGWKRTRTWGCPSTPAGAAPSSPGPRKEGVTELSPWAQPSWKMLVRTS